MTVSEQMLVKGCKPGEEPTQVGQGAKILKQKWVVLHK